MPRCGATDAEAECIYAACVDIGMSMQFMDDVADVTEDIPEVGKRSGRPYFAFPFCLIIAQLIAKRAHALGPGIPSRPGRITLVRRLMKTVQPGLTPCFLKRHLRAQRG